MKYYLPVLLLILPIGAYAAPYKSVDEHGNVTYSSNPPSKAVDVERVKLPPPPTEQQVLESQQAQEEIKNKSELLGKDREKRAMENAKPEAKEVIGEPDEIRGGTSIHYPGRKNQKPSDPGIPERPIRPVPEQPIHIQPVPEQPIQRARPQPAAQPARNRSN